jgi:hypothetical protein
MAAGAPAFPNRERLAATIAHFFRWVVSRMKHLSIFLLLLLTSCGKQAQGDAAKLDRLLLGGQIDRVRVVVLPLSSTNVLSDAVAQRYVLHFREANRGAEPDRTKAQVATEVSFMSDTNVVGWLSQFDNGLWKFEQYSFRLKTSP